MAVWNPWRGCHKFSEGCRNCFIHLGDSKRGWDTNLIVKTPKFNAPVAVNKKGEYSIKSGQLVYCCFSTDFLLEDADDWREECWQMMRQRPDLHFLFLTKRIERFMECIPSDWGDGYDNVTVGCTVETQEAADIRLSFFQTLPIKHKNIVVQPMLEAVQIESYLRGVSLVVLGGEYGGEARPFHLEWAQKVREQCVRQNVSFSFRQCGTYFVEGGRMRKLNYGMLFRCAKECNLDYERESVYEL